MLKIALLTFKLLLLTQIGQSQQLFYLNTLSVWLNGKPLHEPNEINSILSELTNQGYFGAKVDSIRHHTVFLSSGARYTFGEIGFLYNERDIRTFHPEGYYNLQVIENLNLQLLDELRSMGFAFAESILEETIIDSTEHRISLYFNVINNELVTLSRLVFTGSSGMSDVFLERQAGFTAGVTFAPDLVDRYLQALLRSVFIQDANPVGLQRTTDGWQYIINIEESQRNAVDLVLGINPGTGNEQTFVGRGDLRLDNLIVEGSSARLRFERLPLDRSRVEVGYQQYWISGIPLYGIVDTRLVQQDSSYVNGLLRVESGYSLNPALSLGAVGIFTSLITQRSSEISAIQPGRNRLVGLSLRYSSLNSRWSPTSGWHAHLQTMGGRRSLLANAHPVYDRWYSVRQFEFDLRYFYPVTPRVVVAPRFQGNVVDSDVIFEDQLIRFGGALSLRGFREDELSAMTLLWSDLEVRYMLERFSYLYIFSGGGYYLTPIQPGLPGTSTASSWVQSGGLGISYRTTLGMLQFTYAISNRTTITNGMVHFGIVNSF